MIEKLKLPKIFAMFHYLLLTSASHTKIRYDGRLGNLFK
jgi:hypothetical protein